MTNIERYQWFDFEEDESTDAIEGKHVLTIADWDGEEFAVIVHRVTNHPDSAVDGPWMEEKRKRAQYIVDALNAYTSA